MRSDYYNKKSIFWLTVKAEFNWLIEDQLLSIFNKIWFVMSLARLNKNFYNV